MQKNPNNQTGVSQQGNGHRQKHSLGGERGGSQRGTTGKDQMWEERNLPEGEEEAGTL